MRQSKLQAHTRPHHHPGTNEHRHYTRRKPVNNDRDERVSADCCLPWLADTPSTATATGGDRPVSRATLARADGQWRRDEQEPSLLTWLRQWERWHGLILGG